MTATRAGESVSDPTRSYNMKPGDEVPVLGTDFTMTIAKVEDSRCPEGVNCIWAGSVGVELLFCGPKAERSARLNTNAPPRAVKYRGRYFRITQVGPRKIDGQEIKSSDYRITIEVSKNPPADAGEGDVVELKDE